MRDAGKLQRLPSALEMVLRRLSIVDGHSLGCSCPACTREGDARKIDPPFVMLELSQGANVLQYINARHLRDVLPPRSPWDDDQIGHGVMVAPPMRVR